MSPGLATPSTTRDGNAAGAQFPERTDDGVLGAPLCAQRRRDLEPEIASDSVTSPVFAATGLLALLMAADPGLGSGRDGDAVIDDARVINRASPLAADVPAGGTQLHTALHAFLPGELLLLLDTQLPDAGPMGSRSVLLLDETTSLGRFEFARVAAALDAGVYELDAPVEHAWRALGSQAVLVPEYRSLSISDGGRIEAQTWNGLMGGVVALLVQGPLALDGQVRADGAGFRGGRNTSAGEGVSAATPSISGGAQPSGGGSSAGGGGQGNPLSGIGAGGWPLAATPGSRLVAGGGGAGANDSVSGVGGAGGGIIFIRAGVLSGAGWLSADGSPGQSRGYGGGGGAGGTIDLRVLGSASCARLSASGGAGGVTGGGGGGGGRIYVEATELVGCTPSVLAGVRGAPPGDPSLATPVTGGEGPHLGEIVIRQPGGALGTSPVAVLQPTPGAFVAALRPLIAGRGPANSSVLVLLDELEAGSTATDADGGFTFRPPSDLTDGPHRVEARLETGERSPLVSFTVDVTPPAAPTVTSPAAGAVLPTATPVLEGSAEPGVALRLELDGVELTTLVVPQSSEFLAAVPAAQALSPGRHVAVATASDEAGNAHATEVVFFVGPPVGWPLAVGCGCSGPRAPCAPASTPGALGTLAAMGLLAARWVGRRRGWSLRQERRERAAEPQLVKARPSQSHSASA